VHKIFGIPCWKRDVNGRGACISPWTIEFIKNTEHAAGRGSQSPSPRGVP
jgi:hypothetical protein